jgi:UDP:flavonoid glycosyltransferase YjiC (YdhE family)
MAGYVFVPYWAEGHVNPMLPVAAELVSTGAEVRVIVGARFASRVAGIGATPVLTGLESRAWSPPRWGPWELARLARVRLRRAAAMHAVGRRCRQEFQAARPELVIADPMVPGAALVARRLGIPVVWLSTTHARSARLGGTVLVNSLPELQPRRPEFGRRFRFVGPLLASRPHPASTPGEPLLLVSTGTVFERTVGFFRSIIEEFASTEWTVLMATGPLRPAELGALPANVVARQRLPQRAVLAKATVFLTHGGMNSIQEALAEAVPMLLAPRNAEQRATTRRLVELGLGARLNGRVRDQAVNVAYDIKIRAALDEMRARIAQRDGARLAAKVLGQAVL